ncbi:MAG: excinuclease ABC subunit UvrC [Holosporales bacterium]|nr:excinuclease ABC subunit UvrC [Holosporales bacterium]
MKKLKGIIETIKTAARRAGSRPGIYKMINAEEKVIYVGKAKHLKNRLLSYTNFNQLANRTKMMISNIEDVEVTVVNSEIESFLLESNLIKELKPFYNILLKDDKTFPYLVIDDVHEFPRIFKYRTLKPKNKNFFGPYPAISALNETVKVIQKAFLLRNCTDNQFVHRTRPCLQYFIKRCSAPCVNKISKDTYTQNVNLAKELLTGKDKIVRKMLTDKMRSAAKDMNFEQAAVIRDRIKAITEIQSKQYIQIEDLFSIDFIAIVRNFENTAISITFFRTGKNVGSESLLLENTIGFEDSEVVESFILQFYKSVTPPTTIIIEFELKNAKPVSEFMQLSYGVNVKIEVAKREVYRRIIDSCRFNAKMKLEKENANHYEKQIAELCRLIGLKTIDRIEIYDNSHIHGTNACGAMVVFEYGKIQKSKTRKFTISEKTANGGDDIEMMRFSLEKRFKSSRIPEIPNLLIIDGGKTQLSIALKVKNQFKFLDNVKIIGIAKQNDRRMGDEKIVFESGEEMVLGNNSELLSFLITLRNEAHRAAITFHRKKRQGGITKSVLDDIPNIGTIRKKLLLEHFGAAEIIKSASMEDIKMVKGISERMAASIFEFFIERKDE